MSDDKNIEYEIIEAEPARDKAIEKSLYSLGTGSSEEVEAMRILYLSMLGYSRNQIAVHFKMSARRVQEIMKSEEFKIMAQEYSKNTLMVTRLSITMMAEKAMQTMVGLLDSKSEKIRLATAKDLLDRAGLVKKQSIEFTDTTGFDTMDDARLVDVVSRSMQEILQRKELTDNEGK